MKLDTVHVERIDGVAVVRFESGSKKNAMTQQLIQDLISVARELELDTHLQAVVLTGTQESFSAGIDTNEVADQVARRHEITPLERRQTFYAGTRMCEAWQRLPQITIAAIEKMAVGGGLALALTCDMRVMGEDAFAYLPELRYGMILQWGSIPRLVEAVGAARAKRAILLMEKIPANQALAWGLADFSAPPGATESKALEIAESIAQLPPMPVRMVKEAVNAAANAFHAALSYADGDQSHLSMLALLEPMSL
jgi:enoyl-CoA hydratase/carnithine racemase